MISHYSNIYYLDLILPLSHIGQLTQFVKHSLHIKVLQILQFLQKF